MPANDGAQGSTFTFGSVVGKVFDISFSDEGTEIDLTHLTSTEDETLTGFGTVEATIQAYGNPAIARGDTGALSIAWNDGSTETIASAICTKRGKTGRVRGALVTSLSFKKAPA